MTSLPTNSVNITQNPKLNRKRLYVIYGGGGGGGGGGVSVFLFNSIDLFI